VWYPTTWFVHDDSWGSDHFPIQTNISYGHTPPTTQPIIPKWNFIKADWEKYQNYCGSNIKDHTSTLDIPELSEYITNQIITAATLSIPTVKITQSNQVPWWNQDILNARTARKKLLKKARKDKKFIPQATLAKKAVKDLIIKSKNLAWKKMCANINFKTNSREVWKKINQIRGKSRTQHVPSINGSTNTREKIENMAKTFSSVSSTENYSPEFRAKNKPATSTPLQGAREDIPYNQPFTLHELKRVINNKKGSATGLDRTSYPMFKHLPKTSLKILLNFFNKIWKTGIMPQNWKEGLVIPIHKSNKDAHSADSYRPISLTSNLCKTMEGMVTNRLSHHLETNQLLTPHQSGFRKGKSTTDQLVRLHHHIRMAQHQKKYTVAVFLDFSKAFDMVHKPSLLKKLTTKGISGAMHNFITNFLTNRSFQLKMDQQLSDPYPLQNGTPQGSIISPLLFNIMVDDLFNNTRKDVFTSQFADDAALWTSHSNPQTAQKKMQTQLDKITKWTNKWGFKLSPLKSTVILFQKPHLRNHEKIHLTVNNHTIPQKQQTKFLGVIFDHTLNWNSHINSLIERCKADLNILKIITHSKWGGGKEAILLLYRSLIKSKLTYGSEVWSDTHNTNINLLRSIQYQALKIATGALPGTSRLHILVETGEPDLVATWSKKQADYITRSHHNPHISQLKNHYNSSTQKN